jgi:hypothetical protein
MCCNIILLFFSPVSAGYRKFDQSLVQAQINAQQLVTAGGESLPTTINKSSLKTSKHFTKNYSQSLLNSPSVIVSFQFLI